MLTKLKQNKKGIETGLVDFYGTIVIAIIILIFFFIMHVQAKNETYSIQGESFSLDATNIGLSYLRQTVLYDNNEFSVAELLVLAQTDEHNDVYETTLKDITESFIEIAQEDKTKEGIGIIIYYQGKNIVSYGAFSAPGEVIPGPLGSAPPSTETTSTRFVIPTSNPNEPLTVIVVVHCLKGEKC